MSEKHPELFSDLNIGLKRVLDTKRVKVKDVKEIYKVKIEEFCTQNIQKLNELLHLEENAFEELEGVQKRIKTELPDLYDATMMKELLTPREERSKI